jgi:hypothetical protein
MDALDLTKQPPRSPREMLPGLDLAFMARTVDKLRATLPGGNLGNYKIAGFSERLLKGLGIDENAIRDEVARAANDSEIVAWLNEHIDAARVPAVNAALEAPTLASRLDDEEWLAKNPVAKTLPPHTPLLDYLIEDDRAAFARA